MDTTPNLSLPYIMAAQAQKHVTHNEAIRALDALVQIAVLDRDLATPPGSPAEGDRYIVPSGASGAWSGHAGKVAARQDGTWMLYAATEGWVAWVTDEQILLAFDGADWIGAAAPAELQSLPMVGINTNADTTNRLAVAAAASLFTHAGAGHQQKINKNAAGDTASQFFQTAASGRAEIGLAGDDDLHVKVSADGSAWHEAMVVDKDTGNVGFGTNVPGARAVVSDNATPAPAPIAGVTLHVVGANATNGRILFDGFGGAGTMTFRRSRSTAAAPSAVGTNDQMGSFQAYGYGATGYSSGSRATFNFVAAQDWTDTAQGTYARIQLTPNGSATQGEVFRWLGNGDVRIGSDGVAACKLDVDGPVRVKSYTVAGLPSATAVGQLIHVSNETGGAVMAFSDGTNWRRVTDRAIVA
jgi:hypothetical protein